MHAAGCLPSNEARAQPDHLWVLEVLSVGQRWLARMFASAVRALPSVNTEKPQFWSLDARDSSGSGKLGTECCSRSESAGSAPSAARSPCVLCKSSTRRADWLQYSAAAWVRDCRLLCMCSVCESPRMLLGACVEAMASCHQVF